MVDGGSGSPGVSVLKSVGADRVFHIAVLVFALLMNGLSCRGADVITSQLTGFVDTITPLLFEFYSFMTVFSGSLQITEHSFPSSAMSAPQQSHYKVVLRGRLHEPRLAANPGQVASPGPPAFSSQTLLTVQAFDWKKVDPGWRPDPDWQPTRGSCKRSLSSIFAQSNHCFNYR